MTSGKGGEKVARGKRTRIKFLEDEIERFGLKLMPQKILNAEKKLVDSGNYQISNPWLQEGSEHYEVYQAVVRRFEALDGELTEAQKPFTFTIPEPLLRRIEALRNSPEASLESEFAAAVEDIRAVWSEATDDETREMIWQAFVMIPNPEILDRAIPKIPVTDDRELKPWEVRVTQTALIC